MRHTLLLLSTTVLALLLAMTLPAIAKPHPECDPTHTGPIPPGHQKHKDKHCGTDVTGPKLVVTSAPPALFAGTAVWEWTGSDTGSGINHYEMFVVAESDGQLIEYDLNATSPWRRSYSFRSGDTLNWTLTAVDNAGNTTERTGSWIQDNDGPIATINSGPSGVTDDPTFTFDFSVNDASDYQVTCYLFPTPTNRPNAFVEQDQNCTSPKSYDLSNYGDGEYTMSVQAQDALGNVGEAALQTFILDRTGLR